MVGLYFLKKLLPYGLYSHKILYPSQFLQPEE
jgi:hypothetical protein